MFDKCIVVIPARGGSKRLPDKNIMLLGGIPLIAHSINYAKEVGFKNIIVSTDNIKIKEVANEFGAKVLDRPDYLSTDESPTVDAVKHVIENISDKFEFVVLLQPTNPLRPIDLITKAFQSITDAKYSSLMTVTQTYRKFGKIINNRFLPYNYSIGQRSQDLDPLYYENGLLYIAKVDLVLKGKLVGDKNFSLIIDHPFATVDIDNKHDFEHAEFILEKYYKN
jgi:N-acylneuraminate cytidylyltransferase